LATSGNDGWFRLVAQLRWHDNLSFAHRHLRNDVTPDALGGRHIISVDRPDNEL
jgi:hypothetical protein